MGKVDTSSYGYSLNSLDLDCTSRVLFISFRFTLKQQIAERFLLSYFPRKGLFVYVDLLMRTGASGGLCLRRGPYVGKLV